MKRGDIFWLGGLAALAAFLLVPATRAMFMAATAVCPYGMGFLKFAILATMGELLAIRLSGGSWKKPPALWLRASVWGIVGVFVTLMFSLYAAGVAAAVEKGLLPAGPGWFGTLLTAFFASAIMNLTFGPVFMAAHRVSDTWIDRRFGQPAPSATAAAPASAGSATTPVPLLDSIDWPGFIRFVVGKTIPFFWIPAHTVAFLLPSAWRVLYAAVLSIALGMILAWAKRRKA